MHSFSGSLLCITVSYYFLNVNVQYFSILVRRKDLIRQCISGKTKTRNEVTCWTLIYLSVEGGCLCGLNLFQEFNIIKRGEKHVSQIHISLIGFGVAIMLFYIKTGIYRCYTRLQLWHPLLPETWASSSMYGCALGYGRGGEKM